MHYYTALTVLSVPTYSEKPFHYDLGAYETAKQKFPTRIEFSAYTTKQYDVPYRLQRGWTTGVVPEWHSSPGQFRWEYENDHDDLNVTFEGTPNAGRVRHSINLYKAKVYPEDGRFLIIVPWCEYVELSDNNPKIDGKRNYRNAFKIQRQYKFCFGEESISNSTSQMVEKCRDICTKLRQAIDFVTKTQGREYPLKMHSPNAKHEETKTCQIEGCLNPDFQFHLSLGGIWL